MMLTAAVAALILAAPANGSTRTEDAKSAPIAGEAKNKAPDIGELMKMFDKMFPAQPDPDPARLAIAKQSAAGLLPDGTYGKMMTGVLDTLSTRILGMSEADFEPKDRKGQPASTQTLRESILKDDPHFDERLVIIRRVAGEEMAKLSNILEPRLRDGLARSMARRFDAKQLADLNAFLATDSGRSFGAQSMSMWVDPDVMRSIFGAMPDMIMAMPGIFERIEKETAHLPKPKKSKTDTDKKDDSAKAAN